MILHNDEYRRLQMRSGTNGAWSRPMRVVALATLLCATIFVMPGCLGRVDKETPGGTPSARGGKETAKDYAWIIPGGASSAKVESVGGGVVKVVYRLDESLTLASMPEKVSGVFEQKGWKMLETDHFANSKEFTLSPSRGWLEFESPDGSRKKLYAMQLLGPNGELAVVGITCDEAEAGRDRISADVAIEIMPREVVKKMESVARQWAEQ